MDIKTQDYRTPSNAMVSMVTRMEQRSETTIRNLIRTLNNEQ